MSAAPANRYAEKWTYEKTMDRLCAVDHASHDQNLLYLNQVLDHLGLYDDIWSYWRKKWQRAPEIIQMMKIIMQRLEVRLFTGMAKKEIPERVAMFALKHHYGWGREMAAGTGGQTMESLAYVDLELIPAPAAATTPATQDTPTADQQEQPASTSTQAPVIPARQDAPTVDQPRKTTAVSTKVPLTQPVPKPQLPPMEDVLATAVPDLEAQRRMVAYNRLHPTKPITWPCGFFTGTPHPALPAIPFQNGYFITIQM